jgi:hypothetical protein
MKKLFTILCAGLLTVSLSAQTTESGAKFVECSDVLGISFATGGGMAVALSGGYFVTDGLAITAGFGYAKVGDLEGAMNLDLGARYYIGSLFPYVTYANIAEEFRTLNLGAGYAWMLSDNVALEPMFNVDLGMEGQDMEMDIRMGFAYFF